MVEIGKFNKLKVVKIVDFGVYLDGEEYGEILLPRKYVPQDCRMNSIIDVFIHFDSENRIVAVTKKPYAMVGEVGYLKVIAVNSFGTFVDWGLEKDLLVPLSEQKKRMEKDKFYFVYVYIDKMTNRIVGSEKLNKFFDKTPDNFKEHQSVDLLIYAKTNLGYKAIIDNRYWGVLYKNEVFQDLHLGQNIKGFIKKIRPDSKIDLYLYKSGYEKVKDILEQILDYLKENRGFASINDKTPPETIYKLFGVSKKTYKNAIGNLYKKRLISIEKDGIKLLDQKKK
jgi:uncharacterized protein